MESLDLDDKDYQVIELVLEHYVKKETEYGRSDDPIAAGARKVIEKVHTLRNNLAELERVKAR